MSVIEYSELRIDRLDDFLFRVSVNIVYEQEYS